MGQTNAGTNFASQAPTLNPTPQKSQPKPNVPGYSPFAQMSQEQLSFLNQLLQQAGINQQQGAQGLQGFLPGGEAANAINNQAQQRFQQQTIPSILNAFGSGAKSSSALNQALAAGASNLNTDIASQLAQMQLQASQGLSQVGGQQAGLGLMAQPFGYLQNSPLSKIMQYVRAGLPIAGGAAGALIGGIPSGGAGAVPGALLGAQLGGALSAGLGG